MGGTVKFEIEFTDPNDLNKCSAKFIFEDRAYPIEYCCTCAEYTISCSKEESCKGTSCNGGGCPDCIVAYQAFWKLSSPLNLIMERSCIARRKYEKEEYASGSSFISFFDRLGVDWENGERPKGWS